MELKHMQYFVEVVKQKSMTKAAASLFITQPTISNTIKLLEEELEVILFSRYKNQIYLTDAGEAFFFQCKEMLKMYDNIPNELSNLLELKTGRLKIGIPTIINIRILINLISQFHEMYPNITFQLFENGSKKIENDIYYGDLDMGITVLPTNNKSFNTFSFLEEKLKLVVHKNHKLSKRKTVNIEDLKEQEFILFNSDFYLNDKIKNTCRDYGFNPNMIFETTQWSFIEEMLLNNLGICILPEGILELLDNNLKAIDINEPSMKWELAIIWRKDIIVDSLTKNWIKFLQENFLINY
ncbi:cidABC operon transcriptional activator CidR [Staphylococcus kloosii]|uniref:cidABC operon transcriptional activator CidR n=1 Tax=Staphylococcus kloosii TaxID=29384 RepID=UPI000D1ECAB8|nr:LysR family transcriptional regulator [Staphylococcus kloosii]MBF7023255.1 LysR family transcriptional regulator [Staphylococcus kloosii]PTJ74226.1 LysR family transcriptional regulator [Staphylococcus kloosii]